MYGQLLKCLRDDTELVFCVRGRLWPVECSDSRVYSLITFDLYKVKVMENIQKNAD